MLLFSQLTIGLVIFFFLFFTGGQRALFSEKMGMRVFRKVYNSKSRLLNSKRLLFPKVMGHFTSAS